MTLLEEYGLNDKEIKAYIELVGDKELTAYRIAKNLGMSRSTAYDVLERLIAKGFASKFERIGTLFYSANNINRIRASLKDKETILLNLAPKLEQIEKNTGSEIIKYEGIEGQKQFNINLFNLAKNNKISFTYIIGNTHSTSLSSNILIDRLIKEFPKKTNLEFKGLWDLKFKGNKIIEIYNKLGKNKFIKNIPSKSGTIIYDNTVAFLYTTNKPYVIEIRSKLISDELRTYFEHLWSIAK
jgi:sugar-specific transcriptional regulator TrmB